MNQPTTINGVRAYVDRNGTAQLNLEDVARGLGFTQIAASGNEVIRWERVNKYLSDFSFVPTSGDGFIPENIFYRLAMKAKNAAAESFQAKVADEILPTIRKHGGYLTPAKIEEALLNPDILIQLATNLKNEQALRLAAETKLEHQQPLVAFAEICIQSDKSIKVRDLAHSLSSHGIKIGANRLWNQLREWKYIEKNGTEPTQKAVEQELFEVVTGAKEKPGGESFTWRTTYVTTKGQAHIANRLKKEKVK